MDFSLYFKSRQGEMINFLKELVNRESPSSDKKAVDRCSSYVIQEFKKIGTKVTRFAQKDVGDLYLVEYPSKPPKQKTGQLLILTHVDTVWPVGKISRMPFYVSGNKIYGPGALDMKAGLAMAFSSLKALFEMNIAPQKKVLLFINSSEEIGSKASYEVIREISKKSVSVLCLEPALPGGALKMERKGRLVIRLESFGKGAHAGTPERGINAIEELTHQLRLLNKIRKRGITVNIGLIGGGEKANIVPDRAWAVLDVRFWKNFEKTRILNFFRELLPSSKETRLKFFVESTTPPMEKTKVSMNLFFRVKEIAAASLGLNLEAGSTGGGSDASIAASLGIPTVDGLGPEGEGIHTEKEHLFLPSFIQRTALLTELLKQL